MPSTHFGWQWGIFWVMVQVLLVLGTGEYLKGFRRTRILRDLLISGFEGYNGCFCFLVVWGVKDLMKLPQWIYFPSIFN